MAGKLPPAPPVEELPVVEALSMQKAARGYAVLLIKVQGSKVLSTECLTEGAVPRAHAENRLKVEIVNRFLRAS